MKTFYFVIICGLLGLSARGELILNKPVATTNRLLIFRASVTNNAPEPLTGDIEDQITFISSNTVSASTTQVWFVSYWRFSNHFHPVATIYDAFIASNFFAFIYRSLSSTFVNVVDLNAQSLRTNECAPLMRDIEALGILARSASFIGGTNGQELGIQLQQSRYDRAFEFVFRDSQWVRVTNGPAPIKLP